MIFPQSMAIVDIETTGLSSVRDRVIELAILRVEKNQLVESYSTLLNPEMNLRPEIELLTGIRRQDLEKAPRFFDVLTRVRELLADAVFTAHNARFDYSFIRHEFARYDIRYAAREMCTARLFRAVHPGRRHNLNTLISAFNLKVDLRHRALPDAKALWDFIIMLQKTIPRNELIRAIAASMRRPALPKTIPHLKLLIVSPRHREFTGFWATTVLRFI